MKFKRSYQADYQSSLVVGSIMTIVGIGGFLFDPNNLGMNIVNTTGAIILFILAFYHYKKGKMPKDA